MAEANIPYRSLIETFIALNSITSIVEIGCGDWDTLGFSVPAGVRYRGFDTSAATVERNNARFAGDGRQFAIMPEDVGLVPPAQLLIMKDTLQHLGNDSIRALRDTLFAKFTHCLLTDSYRKLNTPQNTDIADGGFRCLDISADPFRLDGAFLLEFPGDNWEFKRSFLHRPNRPAAPAAASPEDIAAIALLGESQRQLAHGHIDAAIAAAEQACHAAPHHTACAVHLAYLVVAHRPLAEAEAACQRALEVAPQDAGALNAFSMCCARADRLHEAIAAARQAVALRPGSVHFHANLGNLLRRAGDMHGAEEAYRSAIACAPDTAAPYRALSLLYAEYGLWQDALVAARRAAELAPDDLSIAAHLAALLAR